MPDRPDIVTVQTRLAILENVVRVCVERGATEAQIREAVEYALRAPKARIDTEIDTDAQENR